jgi:uncharacterized protein YpmS
MMLLSDSLLSFLETQQQILENKLTTLIEFEPHVWEAGLIEIS